MEIAGAAITTVDQIISELAIDWTSPTARSSGGFSTTDRGKPTLHTRDKEILMPKTGLDGLLRPEDSVLALVDHQAFQFANLHSHEPTMIVNNVVGLAKPANLFDVPTILTTLLPHPSRYLYH